MAMNAAYLALIDAIPAAHITHIGLVDDTGTELSGGSYARQAVTWAAPASNMVRPSADLTFNVPAGATVAGWHGYSDATGGTDYDGEDLTAEPYSAAGQYTLKASQTGIASQSTSA